jgi:predicted nucleotidyltransferase
MPNSPSRRKKPGVPMAAIRQYARQVAERFHPDKIILFGSHAHGTPHEDSDVDLLVIMPARNSIDQAVKIRCAFDTPFAMDLIVRTPYQWGWRIAERESFSTEINTKGIVLYDKEDQVLGQKGRGRLRHRRPGARRKTAFT